MIKQISSTSEDWLQSLSAPIRPHLAKIGRFLLVATFLEDSLRIVMQWDQQVRYMSSVRGLSFSLACLFLASVVLAMLGCSLIVLGNVGGGKHLKKACYGLMAVVIAQAVGYGLLMDPGFMLRNLSLIGGLFLLLAQATASESHKKHVFGGLPVGLDSKSAQVLPLLGRILLMFLFASLTFASGELSVTRGIIALISLVSCTMVIVGFKAKTSAALLLAVLSVSNILLNNWWSLHDSHPQKDFVKFDFFQTLSIMGGFLLLIQLGPGDLSVDEQKKKF